MISAHKTYKYGATRRQDLNNGGAKSEEKRPSDWMEWWGCGDRSFFRFINYASNLGAAKSIAPCETTESG